MAEEVHDITEVLPTMEPNTRVKVKRVGTIVGIAVAVLLLIDKLVKRFKREKNVTVIVTDTPPTEV